MRRCIDVDSTAVALLEERGEQRDRRQKRPRTVFGLEVARADASAATEHFGRRH